MRKTLFFAALATTLAVICAVSCKKKDDNPVGNYTCTCIYTLAGTTDTATAPYTNVAKNTASSACSGSASTLTSSGATGVSCTLK